MNDMPDVIYCGHVKEDADGGKDYICTDFGIFGDTKYYSESHVEREFVPMELVEQLIEATEELNALIPRADQMIYDDDFKSFYSVIKSIREHGK